MHHLDTMLSTHPLADDVADRTLLAACLEAAAACAQVCALCADACLAEAAVADLRGCITRNRDCADVCEATARLLSRLGERDHTTLRGLVVLCRQACAACAEECERHAEMHEHCRVCAEACRRCEAACAELIRAL